MQLHRGSGRGRAAGAAAERRPRVVILDGDDGAQVEVLELDGDLAVGASFRHRGVTWTVTGERRGSRALYARPAPV